MLENTGAVNNTIDYSEYTPEKAEEFCELISNGMSLRAACKGDGMPAPKTIFSWLRKYEEFNDMYQAATQERTEAMAEELLDIADDSKSDYTETEDGREVINKENVARARLRVDTRKWLMAKMKPKKYGEKLDLEHSGEIMTKYKELDDAELDRLIQSRKDTTA